jgi:hypothetical protein
MFSTADLGKEVKLVLLNAERVRGTVLKVGKTSVDIETGPGTVQPVPFDRISTRTNVGDFTSDVD